MKTFHDVAPYGGNAPNIVTNSSLVSAAGAAGVDTLAPPHGGVIIDACSLALPREPTERHDVAYGSGHTASEIVNYGSLPHNVDLMVGSLNEDVGVSKADMTAMAATSTVLPLRCTTA